MKSLKKIFIFVIIFLALCVLLLVATISMSDDDSKKVENTITVTILPIKFLVDGITNSSIAVDVLVPAGSSPESYEPVAQQIKLLADSKLILSTGLIAFENALVEHIGDGNAEKIINLSRGIELLAGDCGSLSADHHHAHGVDPHIWTSPKALKIMTHNIYNAIIATYPDSLHYTTNYKNLLSQLDELDGNVADILISNDIKLFLIYHPALTYYSRDYNIEQLSFEREGKEPSIEIMKANIDRARESGASKLFYQREFSPTMVATLAKDIGVDVVEIDPLAENVVENILFITHQIAE